MKFGKGGGLFALLVLTSGCYVYQPVRPSDSVVGTKVRATVSARQAAELSPILRNVTTQVSGSLAQRDGESIMMDVALVGAMQGMSREPLRNRVRIPFGELVSLEERHLSTWRTVVTLGVLGAGVGTTWVLFSGDKAASEKPGTGTDNGIRIRIPVGIGFH